MKLRRWILRTGRTIVGFATETGISRSYLSSLMNGKKKPSKKLVFFIRVRTGGKVKYSGDISDEKIPLDRNGDPSKGQNEI